MIEKIKKIEIYPSDIRLSRGQLIVESETSLETEIEDLSFFLPLIARAICWSFMDDEVLSLWSRKSRKRCESAAASTCVV